MCDLYLSHMVSLWVYSVSLFTIASTTLNMDHILETLVSGDEKDKTQDHLQAA